MGTKAERRAEQDRQKQSKICKQMQLPAYLLLVRHGETNWNRDRRLQGQYAGPDPPELTALGRKQAKEVAKFIAERHDDVSGVLSSDLRRAVQTAEVIAAALPHKPKVEQLPELRERALGTFEGWTLDEVSRCEAWRELDGHDGHDAAGCGTAPGYRISEANATFYERAKEAVLDIGRQKQGSKAVVVCHRGFLAMVHRAAMGHTLGGGVGNGSVSHVLSDGHRIGILQWDEQVVSSDTRGTAKGAYF